MEIETYGVFAATLVCGRRCLVGGWYRCLPSKNASTSLDGIVIFLRGERYFEQLASCVDGIAQKFQVANEEIKFQTDIHTDMSNLLQEYTSLR